MYQIKFACGYEIQVLGSGDNGPCRVIGKNYDECFRGTYDQCSKWLADRGVTEDRSGSQTAAGMAESGRGSR